MPGFPELTAALGDGPVSLRFTVERDIPEILIAHQDDPHLHQQLGRRRPPSGAEVGSACERAPAERAAGNSVALTIVQTGADTCVGQVLVRDLDWFDRRAELCIWLTPGVRGRGLASAALRLASRWLFEQADIVRLAVLSVPENAPLRRAAERAGFADEGTLRSHLVLNGTRSDAVSLALLAEEQR
jgi:RimJ/RimL family protein N-acetyltransferase